MNELYKRNDILTLLKLTRQKLQESDEKFGTWVQGSTLPYFIVRYEVQLVDAYENRWDEADTDYALSILPTIYEEAVRQAIAPVDGIPVVPSNHRIAMHIIDLAIKAVNKIQP